MKTLFILFKNLRLEHSQTEAFRKDLNARTGNRYDLLHNHQADGKNIYRYPQVQFRSYQGYAALYAIDEGAKLVWDLLGSGQLGNQYSSGYEILQNEIFPLSITNSLSTYSIKNIVPFNTENYRIYRALGSLKEKAAFMETKIGTHLVRFCREFGLEFNKGDLEVELVDMDKHPGNDVKEEKMMVFDLVIRTNLNLPDFFGIGRMKSHGAGTVKRL